MIKAVIFDYGGVIKASKALPFSNDLAEIYNLPVEEVIKLKNITYDFYKNLDKGLITEEEFWNKISHAFGKQTPINCKKIARKLYEKDFLLYPEMIDFAKKLKSRGLKTVILSNIIELQAEVIRKNNGYKEFDLLVLSYKEKLRKPDADIYLLTIKKLGLNPKECIFIDDKEENLPPAIKLGMKTILAKNPEQIIKDTLSIISLENY